MANLAKTLVLTSNNRLAQYIQSQQEQLHRAQNKTAWETPAVFPIESWLQHLWQQMISAPQLLLNHTQEMSVWDKIIAENSCYPFLQNLRTATLAQKTWKLLGLWKISLEQLAAYPLPSEETKLFLQWANQFQTICKQNSWITMTEVIHEFAEIMNPQQITSFPHKIIVAGFDELPPAYQYFFKQLEKHCEITFLENEKKTGTIRRVVLSHSEAEIYAMARWAKQEIETHPHLKIGCVIPNITNLRNQIEDIFTDLLTPEKILPGVTAPSNIFNISLGKKLIAYEIVRIADLILNLSLDAVHPANFIGLLQSPYLNHTEDEMIFGAKLAEEIQQWNVTGFALENIFEPLNLWIKRFPSQTGWLTRIRNFMGQIKIAPDFATPSFWATHFNDLLTAIGWPGGRPLNSLEYQLLQRFEKLFLEFRALDITSPSINRQKALQILHTLLNETLFQPQSDEAPIQILGVLEATGRDFDRLWMMGLDDATWPAAPNPNPFIPHALQLQQQMPHASIQREFDYAKTLTKRLWQSAQKIIVSHPKMQEDQQLNASPFIRTIAETDLAAIIRENPTSTTYLEQVFHSAQLENLSNDPAPAISTTESCSGGSDILKQQSLCPFRAFAIHRLGARNKSQYDSIGLTAAQRGIMLHHLLDQVWHDIESQQKLKSLSPDHLITLIQQKISKVLAQQIPSYYSNLYPRLLQIEKRRLQQLLIRWLELEKQRPPFKVLKREYQRQISLGSLTFKIRMDRIDELEDGILWLIDYKTGNTNISDWFGARPEEPQLPLYCAFGNSDDLAPFSGVFFAEIQARTMKLTGTTASFQWKETPGLKIIPYSDLQKKYSWKDWEDMIMSWRTVLEKLAADFVNGIASIDPLNSSTCQTCHLERLCRIKQS